jgi:hypothetical protein
VAAEAAAVQHLGGELDVLLLEEPEEAAVVPALERDRVTLAGIALEVAPGDLQPEPPFLETEREVREEVLA